MNFSKHSRKTHLKTSSTKDEKAFLFVEGKVVFRERVNMDDLTRLHYARITNDEQNIRNLHKQ